MLCCCCCCLESDDPHLEPLISDTLIPRLTQLARQHQTLFALHTDNARRFAALGQQGEAAEAEQKAQREKRYYAGLVQLKRLLEQSQLVLDSAAGVITWNDEVAALLKEMPRSLQQDLGGEFALHFSAADVQ